MKIFITFAALLVLQLGLITYQGEMNYYMYAQSVIKEAAEECACGAALCVDESVYSDYGVLLFDERAGNEYAQRYLDNMLATALAGKAISAECSLEYGVAEVTAEVKVKAKDLFSSPFVSVNEITRTARYEYVCENTD